MLALKPAVLRDDELIEFPRPILVCRIHDRWDFLRMKVPRSAGDVVEGASQDGVEITIEGQVGRADGELTLTEESMLEALLALRAALQPDDADGFSLVLWQSAGSGAARYFRNCTTNRCDYDLSSRPIYSYAVSIHASDPVLYSD